MMRKPIWPALAFTHIVPAAPGFMEAALFKGSEAYRGPVWAARDGDAISIGPQASVRRNLLD